MVRRAIAWFGFLLLAGCGEGGGGATDGGDASGSGDAGWTIDAAGAAIDATPATGDLARLDALIAALPGASAATRRDLVEAFYRDVAYGARGFPIREDGLLAVAFYDEGGEGGALTVAGDFNGWDAGGLPLVQPVAGFGFYYRKTPVAEPMPRTLYKLVRDGSEWFADPWARRFGYDPPSGPCPECEYSLAEAGDAGDASHLERWPAFRSSAGLLAREVFVYVPPGAAPAGGWPVLYAHDGQNLFDPHAIWGGWRASLAADEGIAAGAVRSFLLVGLANTADRFDEYTHVPDVIDSGGAPVGGRGDVYVDFVADEVKPFIDARYATRPAAASTGVMGSSLGGLISFHAVQRRPEVFGAGASLSGTFSWGQLGLANDLMAERYVADPPLDHPLYLDSGGGPGDCGDNYCSTVEMRDTLRSLGWTDGADLAYVWDAGAEHNEAAWAARLPEVLVTWFPGTP